MTPMHSLPVVAAALMLAAATAQAAGTVEVVFVQPERFTDFAQDSLEIERAQRELREHMTALAQRRLPDGRSLRIEVLDVDMAGTLRPIARRADWVRVVRSPLDAPRIRLRYELREGERLVAQGEDRLEDASFPWRLWRNGHEPMGPEKRLLDRWFAEHVSATPPG